MEDSNKRQRQYASSLQISVKGSQQSHHNQVFILNLKTILDIVPLFIPLCLIIDRHLQCTLFWPPDACLLPHNYNNNDDINNSTDNNHLQRNLFWPPDARLLPHPAGSLQAEHLLARGSKVSNHRNILGIN